MAVLFQVINRYFSKLVAIAILGIASLLSKCSPRKTDMEVTEQFVNRLDDRFGCSLFSGATVAKPYNRCSTHQHTSILVFDLDVADRIEQFDDYLNFGSDEYAVDFYNKEINWFVESMEESECCYEYAHQTFDDFKDPFSSLAWFMITRDDGEYVSGLGMKYNTIVYHAGDEDSKAIFEKSFFRDFLICFLDTNNCTLRVIHSDF